MVVMFDSESSVACVDIYRSACPFPGVSFLMRRNVFELGERDVCWGSYWTRAPGRSSSDHSASNSGVASREVVAGWHIVAFSAGFEQYAALLAPVRRRGRKATRHRSQAPFLDVGFNKHKAHLSEIDVYRCRAICSYTRKKVLRFHSMGYVVELSTISGKKHGSGSRFVSYAYDIPLHVLWAVGSRMEWLVMSAIACR